MADIKKRFGFWYRYSGVFIGSVYILRKIAA